MVTMRTALRGRAPMGRAPQKPGVRVEPANDAMRRLLKHPRVGRFRSTGSMEWPDDKYTRRRLADGSIKQAEAKAEGSKHEHRSKTHAEFKSE
jgi:hypothetical protein